MHSRRLPSLPRERREVVLLRPSEVARLAGVRGETVWAWRERGLLPAVETPGGHARYRPDDVKAFLRSPSFRRRPAGNGTDV